MLHNLNAADKRLRVLAILKFFAFGLCFVCSDGVGSGQSAFSNIGLDNLVAEVVYRDTEKGSCPDGVELDISQREAEDIAWREYLSLSKANRNRSEVGIYVSKAEGKCAYVVFVNVRGKENRMPAAKTSIHMSTRFGVVYGFVEPR